MKALSFVNLAGLLALAVLCVFQWRENRRLNLEINGLETVRFTQQESLEDRERVIQGQTEDLSRLREQITRLTDELRTTEGRLNLAALQSEQSSNDMVRLKESVVRWTEAVEERDRRIVDNHEQIRELAGRLNEAILNYNELATNYNEAVLLLNERTADYNELVDRFNEVASTR